MKACGLRLALCLFMSGLLLLFAGCAPPPREERGQIIESENGDFPKVAVDYAGREVRFEGPPESYVSTLPANTEILFALGLGDKVIAVSVYCDYPPEIKEKDLGWREFDLEKIGELVPDLLLAGAGQELFIDVAGLVPGVTTFVMAPLSFDEAVESILVVGEITERKEKASQIADEMWSKKETVVERSAQVPPDEIPDVLVLASPEELVAAGKRTITDELIEMAAGNNIAAVGEGYHTLEQEELIELDPEAIVFLGPWEEYFLEEERYRELRAFQEDRLYTMEEALLTRPGPRLAEGLEELFALLHGT